jgi:hypothetical protein
MRAVLFDESKCPDTMKVSTPISVLNESSVGSKILEQQAVYFQLVAGGVQSGSLLESSQLMVIEVYVQRY